MAEQMFFMGSLGPFFYDDEDDVVENQTDYPEDDVTEFDGIKRAGLVCRRAVVMEEPEIDEDVVRKVDIDDFLGDAVDLEVLTEVTETPTTLTVVTGVDFGAETVTTEEITIYSYSFETTTIRAIIVP